MRLADSILDGYSLSFGLSTGLPCVHQVEPAFLPLWLDMDVETLTSLAADRFYDV
jgi:hypothetical protein